MVGERLVKIDMNGNQTVVAHVPGRATGLGFMPDGTPVVMSMFQKKLFRVERDRLVEVADLSEYVEHPVNDMIVDSHGKAYLGNMGYDFFHDAEPAGTYLLRVDPDGTITQEAGGLIFPNGMAITADGKRFYVSETYGNRIMVFDIEPNGSLTDGRVHVDFGDRTPDGICLDAEGALWVASAHEDLFIRVLRDGSIDDTHSISTPGRFALACVLGGPDGRTLFMMEAVTTKEKMRRDESEGFVRAVTVPVARDASIP
jgi:sugar lactone lactonase YvrE